MNNLKLAETHSSNRKLVAYCVAKASLLALIVNACVIPAGLLAVLTFILLPWYAYILPVVVLLPIGALLAIVVDGMTMGACARLRRTLEQRVEILNRYNLGEKLEPENEAKRDQELAMLRPSIGLNTTFIVLFSVISVGAGELFWHWLLSGLPTWFSWTLSTLFSLAVSTCLVASELLKYQNEQIIQESIESTKYHKQAFLADSEESAMKRLHSKFDTKVTELAEQELMSTIVEEKAISIYNDILFDGESVIKDRLHADIQAKQIAEMKRQEHVNAQREMLGQSVDTRDTGPVQQLTFGRGKRLGNAAKVQTLVDKYGEGYVRQNIDLMCTEVGLSKPTIYGHLKTLKQV